MPGTNVPPQMFDFELNQKKGWPSPYAVDYSAPLKAGETGIRAGMAISLDSNGEIVRGLSAAGAMPIFALQNQADFDVLSDVGNVSGGNPSGLVACGAYELQTTEFVTDTYAPNDQLTVDDGGVTPANKGKLRKVSGAEDVVGIVSAGQTDSEHNATIKLLAFWPVYLPA